MPEAPEVLYLAQTLHKRFAGHKLTSMEIVGGRYKKHGAPHGFHEFQRSGPTRLQTVTKKGKVLFFEFENGWYMISRLGLTGWWYENDNVPEWRNGSHASVVLHFGTRLRMTYDDQLSYGTIVFCERSEAVRALSSIAPDITDKTTTWSLLIKDKVHSLKPSKTIEDVLVDQGSILSGIGNYLKSEILYAAKIAPMRKVGTLSEADWKRLLRVAKSTTRRMLKAIYSDDPDAYEKTMKVYMKKQDPNGYEVVRYKNDNNRMTYWVPQVQQAI